MKQYECDNVPQLAHKVAELTNTKVDRDTWKENCSILRTSKNVSDTIDYIALDENDEPYDVSVFFGYDGKQWLVGICYE